MTDAQLDLLNHIARGRVKSIPESIQNAVQAALIRLQLLEGYKSRYLDELKLLQETLDALKADQRKGKR